MTSQWSYNLLCNPSDFETICVSTWFPCLAYGFNKQKLDALDNKVSPHWCGPSIAYCGSNIVGAIVCLIYSPLVLHGTHVPLDILQNIVALGGSLGTACYSGNFRKRIREKYNIKGNLHGDICTHFWCSPCALCQETLEIHNRYFIENFDYKSNLID